MNTQTTILDNGLTIVTSTNKNVGSVMVALGVKVGGRYESQEQLGISHLLEHMAFKGTKTRTVDQIANEVDFIGGKMNAYTSKEETVYYVKVIKDHVELAVDIVCDIVCNSIIPADELEKEKQVVIQEIKSYEDDPHDVSYTQLMSGIFKDNSLGENIIGTEGHVLGFSREDILSYINEYYNPKNMVASVSGNVEHDVVVELFQKYFTKEATSWNPKELKSAELSSTEKVTARSNLQQVNFIFSFPAYSRKGNSLKENMSMRVLHGILSGGMSSILFREIREKRGLVYFVGSTGATYDETGTTLILGGTDTTKVHELTKTVGNVLRSLKGTITEDMLQKSKNGLKSSVIMGLENTDKIALSNLSSMFNYSRPSLTEKEFSDLVDSVTMEDIHIAVDTILNKDKVGMSFVGPAFNYPTLDWFKETMNFDL